MLSWILNTSIGLVILWLIGFSFYCAYLRMMLKIEKNNANRVTLIVWHWGEAVIIGSIVIVVFTASLVFASIIMHQLGMILIGG